MTNTLVQVMLHGSGANEFQIFGRFASRLSKRAQGILGGTRKPVTLANPLCDLCWHWLLTPNGLNKHPMHPAHAGFGWVCLSADVRSLAIKYQIRPRSDGSRDQTDRGDARWRCGGTAGV